MIKITMKRVFLTTSLLAIKLFALVSMVIMPAIAFAQEDVKSEILNYTDSMANVVSKGRGLLAEKFVAGDLEKVKQIKDYLKGIDSNKDYFVFYAPEYSLILYWTSGYKELLERVAKEDSFYSVPFRRMRPQNDLLLQKLVSKTEEQKQRVLGLIDAADLQEVDKDFLRLNLENTLAHAGGTWSRDTLNRMANDFLSKHPGSKYDGYVRKRIRYQVTTDWGLGVEFFSGYGFFTGNLSQSYTNSIPIGVAFDVQYKNWVLYLRDYIGFSKTKKDLFPASGVWAANSQARVFVPEASIGYVVTDGRLFKVAPFVGISSMDIGPTSSDQASQPSLKYADMGFSRTYTCGLNADIKLSRPKARKKTSRANNDFRMVRVRYSYNMPQFQNAYPGVTGYFHSITIGVGSFEKRTKRKY